MMKVNKLKYSSFSEYVFKINYGYVNNEGKIVPDKFINPTAEYHLQTPYELTKNEYGICFDIVELSRDYFNSRNILCESYYIEYKKDDIFESYAFLIYKRKNNLWYECPDNSWADLVRTKGYFDKEVLIKNVYDWFQGWIYKEYQKIDKSYFYFNKYDYPEPVYKDEMTLHEFCTQNNYDNETRNEYSGMAIVFCNNKVLILETKHNEFVFPKGHIEDGETSLDAAIRECREESGIVLSKDFYLGECSSYSYVFSAGHLKITNDDFKQTFGVNRIKKKIFVHTFIINEFQEFHLENIFIKGNWVNITRAHSIITHDNTKKIYLEALELRKKALKNKAVNKF